MARRHRDALAISQGACNPSGIAYSTVAACREVWDEGKDPCKDQAIRLMVYQMAFICRASELDDLDAYRTAVKECEKGT